MNALFKKILEKLKGNRFGLWPTFLRLIQKGGIPLLRGLRVKLIHPFKVNFPFYLGKGVRIHNTSFLITGKNVYIGDYSYMDCLSLGGVKLGNNVTIREFAWCQLTSSLSNPGELIEIGDNSYIGPRVVLGAAASLKIGSNCQIGSGVNFIAENHKFSGNDDIFNQGVIRKGIVIGNDCWIGNNVIILDGIHVGDGAVIGAGSVVTKEVPRLAVVVGNPAKVMRFRNE